jgi:phosphoribosylamine--glycine ligase
MHKIVKKLNVLIFGWGTLESEIIRKFNDSDLIENVYLISSYYNNISNNYTYLGSITNLKFIDLKNIISKYKIDFAISFNPVYAISGFIDYLKYNLKLPVVGVTKKWITLETSKEAGKIFMKENNIKMPDFMIINSEHQLKNAIEKFGFPIVVKNNYVQAGFGSHICKDEKSAKKIIKQLLKSFDFCILERFIKGKEISQQYLWDTKKLLVLEPVKDFKKSETGINTGGLACYTPVNLTKMEQNLLKNYNDNLNVIFQKLKPDFTGIFTVNLLFTENELYTLEFNMRPGIAEFETLIEHIENDLLEIFNCCVQSKLDELQMNYKKGVTGCIVVAPKKYVKQSSKKQKTITLKKSISPFCNDIKLNFNSIIFKDNDKVIIQENKPIFSAICTDKINPFDKIYKFLNGINSKEIYYRKDIGITNEK